MRYCVKIIDTMDTKCVYVFSKRLVKNSIDFFSFMQDWNLNTQRDEKWESEDLFSERGKSEK